MNTVQVMVPLNNGEEIVNIPVNYEIERDGNRGLIKCKVNLTKEEMPEWLTLTSFDIPVVHGDGVTSTHYSHIGNLDNMDTATFVSNTGDAIRFAESIKQNRK